MDNLTSVEENLLENRQPQVVKVFKLRWVILFIYILYSAMNAFQWMEYCIITNLVMRYYDVTAIAVDWTSIIYMALYPFLVVPVSYVIDTKGLRVAALIGGLGTAVGVAIKVLSIGRNLFWVVLIGQTICSAAQVFVLCLPSKIAAVWFPPSEMSKACSLAVLGTQLGFALGLFVPSTIVKNHNKVEDIGSDLRLLCWGLAIFMIPVSVAIIFLFQKQPLHPPSVIQSEERKKPQKKLSEFVKSFKELLSNRGFLIHMFAYGINVSVFSCIGTFLNQFVLHFLPDAGNDLSILGLLIAVLGMLGSLIFGYILDKTHKYKESTLVIAFFSFLSIILWHYTLNIRHKYLVYLTAGILGFFINAYLPVAFELAIEITFPFDESTTTGLLNAASQGFGVLFTIILGEFNLHFGSHWSLLTLEGLMLLGTIMTYLIPNVLKRQIAIKSAKLLK